MKVIKEISVVLAVLILIPTLGGALHVWAQEPERRHARDIAPECDALGEEQFRSAQIFDEVMIRIGERIGGPDAIRNGDIQAEIVRLGEYSLMVAAHDNFRARTNDVIVCMLQLVDRLRHRKDQFAEATTQ